MVVIVSTLRSDFDPSVTLLGEIYHQKKFAVPVKIFKIEERGKGQESYRNIMPAHFQKPCAYTESA